MLLEIWSLVQGQTVALSYSNLLETTLLCGFSILLVDDDKISQRRYRKELLFAFHTEVSKC